MDSLGSPMNMRSMLFDARIVLGVLAGLFAMFKMNKRNVHVFLYFVLAYYITIMVEHLMKQDYEKKGGWRKEMPVIAKAFMFVGFAKLLMQC